MKSALIGLAIAFASITAFSSARALASSAVEAALSRDPVLAQQATASLREAGPAGLAALLDRYDQSHDARLLPVIDAVAAQRDAVYSRLYWYTDLEKAEAAASAAHMPILYLRMLGRLTDEYSCANSRFFRTVLYANAEVSKFLREQYVLVWISERPVPVVTIDYGDGRILRRTITGNSIHYIMTSHGQVIDALPGLYDPKTFLAIVSRAGPLAARDIDTDAVAKYLRQSDAALRSAWQADAQSAAPELTDATRKAIAQEATAMAAMRVAVSKSKVERPLLVKLSPRQMDAVADRTLDAADESAWQKLAALHAADAALDGSSLALLKSQNPAAYGQAGLFDRTVAQFQQAIALDTVHNNYQLRRKILSWLSAAPGQVGVEDLNRRVYAELFLTPRSDPWLGLKPEATYTGLMGDGYVAPTGCRSVSFHAGG